MGTIPYLPRCIEFWVSGMVTDEVPGIPAHLVSKRAKVLRVIASVPCGLS